MGGYNDAKTWYECGLKCSTMLNDSKSIKEFKKNIKTCNTVINKEKPTLPTDIPSNLNEIVSGNVENEDIANSLGLDSPLLYVPLHTSTRLDSTHHLDQLYMNTITKNSNCQIKRMYSKAGVGGNRGLYNIKTNIKKGSLVLSDLPLLSISFGKHLCDHCGCPLPTSSQGRSIKAIDGHAEYCTKSCRDSAFSQYYAYMSSSDGEGMSEKYSKLRSQYAGTKNAPLIQSFHVLAALRICAITEQCKKRGELNPNQGTFDMPSFRCLLRPGDLGLDVLNKSGYRLPFNEQYRAYEQVREIMPTNISKQVNRYDMRWYDNIWGLLMMNCVNGGGVAATGEVTSVCLMRAGSFINHSTTNYNAVLLPNRDKQKRLCFTGKCF